MPSVLKSLMLSVEGKRGMLGVAPADIQSVARRSKTLINVTKNNGDVLKVDNTSDNRKILSQRGWSID